MDDGRGSTPGCGTLRRMPWSVLALAAALVLPAAPSPAGSQVPAALAVLHRWDSARSAAYAAGDRDRLRALYAAGSPAGAADVRLLAAYRAHGWRVTVVTTQVRAVRVLGHAPGRWVLRTTDRVRGLADTPQRCRVLPAGRYRTHDLTRERLGSGWVIASVRLAPGDPAAGPAPVRSGRSPARR